MPSSAATTANPKKKSKPRPRKRSLGTPTPDVPGSKPRIAGLALDDVAGPGPADPVAAGGEADVNAMAIDDDAAEAEAAAAAAADRSQAGTTAFKIKPITIESLMQQSGDGGGGGGLKDADMKDAEHATEQPPGQADVVARGRASNPFAPTPSACEHKAPPVAAVPDADAATAAVAATVAAAAQPEQVDNNAGTVATPEAAIEEPECRHEPEPAEEEEENDYEAELRNIERNNLMLASLGLFGDANMAMAPVD